MKKEIDELSPEQKSEWNRGVNAAKAALDASDKPIFMMDELPILSLEPSLEAMGWNSVWAGQENSSRIKKS